MTTAIATVPRRSRSALHPYQVRAVQWLVAHAESGIFLDPGMGKTVITLSAIADLRAAGVVRRVLVVGPPRVVAAVWAQEAQLWEHTAHLNVLVLTGTAEQRLAKLKERLASADVVCVSYGLLPWLHKTVKRETWDWLIVEESSAVKNHETKRWKATAYSAMTAKRRTVLTGTPTPKSHADLWGQVTIADLGKRFGRDPRRFLARYFDITEAGRLLKPECRRELTGKLKDFAIALRAKDYLDMPPLIETDVPVQMPDSALDVYAELTRTFQAQLDDGLVVDVANAGVMVGKLQQLCIAKGTEVLTNRGWVAIESLSDGDRLWDGVEWVTFEKLVDNGVRPVIRCYEAMMTPDHRVLTVSGWREAQEVVYGNDAERLNRAEVRLPDCVGTCTESAHNQRSYLAGALRLRNRSDNDRFEFTQWPLGQVVRVQARGTDPECDGEPRQNREPAFPDLVRYAATLQRHQRQGLQKLWRARYQGLRALGRLFSSVLGGHAGRVQRQSDSRADRQQRPLLARKLPMGNCKGSMPKYAAQPSPDRSRENDDVDRRIGEIRENGEPCMASLGTRVASGKSTDNPGEYETSQVFDVLNAGPRNRFTVRGADKAPFLVHNCQGALYTDDAGSWSELHTAKIEAVVSLVDELQGEPVLIAYWHKFDLARLKARYPDAPVLGGGLSAAKLNALIDAWNRREVPILLLNPMAAGHGLNLQAGGRHMIWLATPWSWELVQQTTARIYRQGQARPVMIYRVIVPGTIDERILRVLAERQGGHEALVAALKAEVRETVERVDRLKEARAAMQRAHPDRGGSEAAFIAARKRFEEEKQRAAAA